MAVVTISRHFGAGGHTLGEKLCERYGLRLVDASTIEQLARKAKISPNWLSAMEKEASSTLLSAVSSVVSRGLFYKGPGTPLEREDRRRYIEFLSTTFSTMADEDGYVVVGRGAQCILKDHPKALHFLLVADYESRVSFLMEHHDLSRPEAESEIRARERERAALGSRLFEANLDEMSLYHLILNTGRLPYEVALEAVYPVVAHFLDRWKTARASPPEDPQ